MLQVCPLILITGHGDIDMAVGAIKDGAFDFIEKPFDEARLVASIRRAVKEGRESEVEAARSSRGSMRFQHVNAK